MSYYKKANYISFIYISYQRERNGESVSPLQYLVVSALNNKVYRGISYNNNNNSSSSSRVSTWKEEKIYRIEGGVQSMLL